MSLNIVKDSRMKMKKREVVLIARFKAEVEAERQAKNSADAEIQTQERAKNIADLQQLHLEQHMLWTAKNRDAHLTNQQWLDKNENLQLSDDEVVDVASIDDGLVEVAPMICCHCGISVKDKLIEPCQHCSALIHLECAKKPWSKQKILHDYSRPGSKCSRKFHYQYKQQNLGERAS